MNVFELISTALVNKWNAYAWVAVIVTIKQYNLDTVITGVLPAPVYNPHPMKIKNYVLKSGV